MNPRFRISAGPIAALALLATLAGCINSSETTLDEFTRWHQEARAQAQIGALSWSEFYKQSFDRLTALPPSLQQDRRLESTVLLLSTARKFEAAEMTAQQFAQEREHLEARLEARVQ